MAEKAGINLRPSKIERKGHFFERNNMKCSSKGFGQSKIPLSFVFVVCNGEFELITETNCYMT